MKEPITQNEKERNKRIAEIALRAQQVRDTAPELLEALRFCRSVIHAGGMFERSEQLAVDMADKAIAKATDISSIVAITTSASRSPLKPTRKQCRQK